MGKIEFRLGLAGTGKSEGIADEIANEVNKQPLGPRILWVVPGVASYTSERRLLQRLAGTVRAEVIHLNRLAQRANSELYATTATPVNNTGKRLLLAAVYQDCLEDLQVLHRVEPSIRFLDAILDVFEEMSLFAVTPDQIEAQLEVAATRFGDLDPLSPEAVASQSLIGKLRDISVLYVRWKNELRVRDLYDPSDLPQLLAPRLEKWTELQNMKLYIDGFSDISPRDALFISALAEYAEHTVVTLPLRTSMAAHSANSRGYLMHNQAEGLPWQDPLVLQAWMSFRRLSSVAEERGLEIQLTQAPVPAAQGRFAESPDLAALTQFLAGERAEPCDWNGQIDLAQAQNSRAECDGVAAAIAASIEQADCAFEDCAVLVPDLDRYSAQLAESFQAYSIPFSMDTYPALASHPLTKFLLASLMAVEGNLSVETMKRYLKTDFCGLTLEEADWLESYIQAREVEGAESWLADQPWQFAQNQSDAFAVEQAHALDRRADTARRKVITALGKFIQQLPVSLTPAELAHALWELLVDAGAKRKVAQWLVDEGTGSDMNPGEGSLHEQAWMKWMNLLNDLSETRAGKPLPRSFLFSLVYEECVTQSLTTIPAGLHQVRVMSFDHALAWEAKRVFIMGASDGVLPSRVGHQGLLQDEERRQFAALFNQRLGYTTDERQAFQRAFVYSVFSRASHHLTLSAPLSNQDGKAIRPSLLFGQMSEWFRGQCPQVLWTRETSNQLFLESGLSPAQAPPGRLLEHWLPYLQNGNVPVNEVSVLRAAMTHYLETEPWRTVLAKGIAGTAHKTYARPLVEQTAKHLYGTPLYANVHQLETFASCSYRYFLQYGLRLRPEEIPEITPAERGTLVHDVLQGFVAKHMEDPFDWRGMSDSGVQESMREVFEEVLQRPVSQIWTRKPSRLIQARETLQLLQRAAVVLTNHMRRGEFVPAALELSFGSRAKANDDVDDGGDRTDRTFTLPLLTFTAGAEEVYLRGRVDRVDIARQGGDSALRIIDYKSSALDLDVTRIENGLRLQLPLYGAAVAKYSDKLFDVKATLAGLLYLPIQSGTSVTASPTAESAALAAQVQNMRSRGWLLADDTFLQWMDSELQAGKTDLFKKVYKKDGSYMKDAPVLTQQQWEGLLGRVLYHVQTLSEKILAGQIDIQPYQLQTEESCAFCPYQSVCQIDKRWDMSPLRKLVPLTKDHIDGWGKYSAYWEAFMQSRSDES